MVTIILVIHILLATTLVGVVLLQRSEGGALGGLGGGTFGGLMTGRGTANLLTRTTAVLAGCFIATSLLLAVLAGGADRGRSILDTAPPAPVSSDPVVPTPPAPTTPDPASSIVPAAPAAPPVAGAPAAGQAQEVPAVPPVPAAGDAVVPGPSITTPASPAPAPPLAQ